MSHLQPFWTLRLVTFGVVYTLQGRHNYQLGYERLLVRRLRARVPAS